MQGLSQAPSYHSPRYNRSENSREEFIKAIDAIGTHKRCKRRQEICNGEEKRPSWYRVLSGGIRRYTIHSDGRRQITGLILPGDFFGFRNGDSQGWVMEAICDGTAVVEYPPNRIEALAASDLEIAHELFQVVFQTISRLEEQVLTIGRAKAAEKVALFVLHISKHPSLSTAPVMTLPLSRYDIADYLAISPETVCRCFTDLRNQGVIRLLGPRQFTITNREALEDRVH